MGTFDKEQFKYFAKVENKRFFWQTGNAFIVEKEKEILSVMGADKKQSVLEVGCGEGANIFNLDFLGGIVGIDYSLNRLKFAKNQINNKKNKSFFVCGDGSNLPFLNNKFDLVFSKDVFHHLNNKKMLISEMVRACKQNGTLCIAEMNGRTNFIGKFFASLVRNERGMKHLNIREIISFLDEAGAINIKVIMKQPLLFYRVLFHYRLFTFRLSIFKPIKKLVNSLEEFAEHFIKEEKWGYIIILAENP